MPIRVVLRCRFCDATPDHVTQQSLQGLVKELVFGEYVDALPGRWLVWNATGLLGPPRYACPAHRGELVAELRREYATVNRAVWTMPPYPQRWPGEDRPCAGEESPRPASSKATDEFDLRDCLLQDRSPPTPDAGTDPRGGPKEAPFSPEGLEAGDLFPPGEVSPPISEPWPPEEWL